MSVPNTWTRYFCRACLADEIIPTPGHLRAVDEALWAETILRLVSDHHSRIYYQCGGSGLNVNSGAIRFIVDADETRLRAMSPEAFAFEWESHMGDEFGPQEEEDDDDTTH